MAPNKHAASAMEIDRLAMQLAKDPHSKAFMPLSEEYGKAGMWQEAAAVLEDGLKYYPGFITAMVALGRAYDQMGQTTKAKAILEEAVKLSPENLRAHRTLVKIYSAQGFKEDALKSCAVIMAVNPFDEEARSARAALGSPDQPGHPVQKNSKPTQSAPPAAKPVIFDRATVANKSEAGISVSDTRLPAPVETPAVITHPLDAAATAEPVSAQNLFKEPSGHATPLAVAADLIEHALQEHDMTGEHEAVLESPSPEKPLPASTSLHAGVVVQLESWLRTIQSRRRDHDHRSAA